MGAYGANYGANYSSTLVGSSGVPIVNVVGQTFPIGNIAAQNTTDLGAKKG